MASGFGLPPSWRIMATSAEPSTPPLVTTMPAAVETRRAGIWLTRPSPTVRVVKVAAAVGEGHAVAEEADGEAAEDVDDGDQQAGDGVAADELGGAVHGAEEAAFLLELAAALAGGGFVDEAGGEVGVDGHLLAGHRVEAEAGGDLGDAAGALGDDHEVHDEEDGEEDDTDDDVTAHEEAAERLDDVAGGGGAFVAVAEDEAGGCDVEGEAEEGGEEEEGWEAREIERAVEEHGDHQDEHGGRDGEGEAEVEQGCGEGEDEDGEEGDDAEGEADVGTGEHGAGAGEPGLHHAATPGCWLVWGGGTATPDWA